jgi:hypothetical protein
MASATKTWRRFVKAVERAPADAARFEVGIAWHEFHKWRCYQKVGAAMLFSIFSKTGKPPQWPGAAEDWAHCFAELSRAADVCELKNRQRALPAAAAHPLAQRIE